MTKISSLHPLFLAVTVYLSHCIGRSDARCYFDRYQNNDACYSVRTDVCFAPEQDGSGCMNAMASYDYYSHLGFQRLASVKVEARYGCIDRDTSSNKTDACAIAVDGIRCHECQYNDDDFSITMFGCPDVKGVFPAGQKQTIKLLRRSKRDPYFKLAHDEERCSDDTTGKDISASKLTKPEKSTAMKITSRNNNNNNRAPSPQPTAALSRPRRLRKKENSSVTTTQHNMPTCANPSAYSYSESETAPQSTPLLHKPPLRSPSSV